VYKHWNPDLTGGFLEFPGRLLAPQVITFCPVLGILVIWFVIDRVRKNQRMVNNGAEHANAV
jgi:hypothetical protein